MRYQPQGRTRFNFDSSIARDIICSVIPASRWDAALSTQYNQDGAYSTTTSPVGLGLQTNGSNSAIWLPIKSIALTRFTVFGVFKSNNNAIDTRALALGSSSNTVPIIQIGSGATQSSKVRLYARSNSNVTPTDTNSVASAFDGNLHTIAITYNGAQLSCYIDGILDSTNTFTSATITVDRFCIGGLRRSTTGQWWAGSTYFGAAWKRDLNDSEIESLSKNPWQLFKEPTSIIISNLATNIVNTSGSITATSTINGEVKSISISAGSSSGSVNVGAVSKSITSAECNILGTSSIAISSSSIALSNSSITGSSYAFPSSKAIISVDTNISGNASMSCSGLSVILTRGSVESISTFNANSSSIILCIGEITGTSQVTGNSSEANYKITVGSCNGTSEIVSVTKTIHSTIGSIECQSLVDALVKSVVESVGQCQGTSVLIGLSNELTPPTELPAEGPVTVSFIVTAPITTLLPSTFTSTIISNIEYKVQN